MKIAQKKKEFIPVTITIETQAEFDFLYGLTEAAHSDMKMQCEGFDSGLDRELFNLLNKIKESEK